MPIDLTKDIERQIVRTTSLFAKDESFEDERFMRARVAAMHSGKNRNKTFFSKDVILAAKDSFANIPVLADVQERTDDNGNKYYDYTSHSIHIEEDAFDSEKQRIIYDEKVVGIIPETNNFELVHDDETGNDYVYVDALLYRDYGNYVCDILESRGGTTDVSMEISVDDLTYSAKNKYIEVGKMRASGLTLLGSDVTPGMKNAHATMFSLNNDDKQSQLIRIMQELKESLEKYNQNISGKEETLMDEETKVLEEVTEDVVEETTEEVAEESTVEVATEEDFSEETVEETPAEEQFVLKTFKLSHDDIRVALYELIEPYCEADQDYYYISAIYDDNTMVMEGCSGVCYGQKFRKDDDNVILDGERYRVYAEYVTESEKVKLDEMRANYSSISEKLEKYESAELEKQRMDILTSAEYSSISTRNANLEYNYPEYAELLEKHEYSLDELRSKLDAIVLNYAKQGVLNFAAEHQEEVKPEKKNKVTRLPIDSKVSAKRGRYGNLFN